ncbi:MAG TPA: hypothetical protein VFU79_00560 [Nitrososphaeraceae archaeon]|jgi:hypothetical protein|nr:hypothetical protein [Nitrososphaeraceae archaeon]
MVNRILNVQDFFFFPGKTARYEGHFLTSSSDPILIEITRKINESISEIPQYQLLLNVQNSKSYEISDCRIYRFENRNSEYTTCYFFSNDIEEID